MGLWGRRLAEGRGDAWGGTTSFIKSNIGIAFYLVHDVNGRGARLGGLARLRRDFILGDFPHWLPWDLWRRGACWPTTRDMLCRTWRGH